ncbi:AraC family transcriptional regulator [Flavitalea sp. BT771]|uniref:helix-turn-helix domain-containing protein n=1 Tax=Flavitalea sp. BT771 TaxID=3063329 RepID=UPI0026E1D321|nr:AraC family transcriptional regulator [Flavitalea sp. BT771]MDO6431734.1 AraC family transcriptional regulator [Flavitalea sp. BT771]MDV6220642.1 AraC family transcriptional regulator [Flavitalea sp. BT771]
MPKIKVYDSRGFTERYMASPELGQLMKGDFSQFFIVRVEDMYRLVREAVPASRSTGHTFIYITEGEAIMTIGSRRYKTRRGELLLVPAGQVFSFGQGDVNKGYLCHFQDALLQGIYGKNELIRDFGFLSSWGFPYHIRSDRQSSQFILQLFKRLFFEYSTYGLERMDIIQPYLLVLLCEINQVSRFERQGHRPGMGAMFEEFRKLVYTHFRTKRLVTDYASLLHVTPNHLNKNIKAFTGKSPTQWIDEMILAEAKVLLRQTSLSISAVALEVGFTDQSYFARLFRKYEGVTPSSFREGIEKS